MNWLVEPDSVFGLDLICIIACTKWCRVNCPSKCDTNGFCTMYCYRGPDDPQM